MPGIDTFLQTAYQFIEALLVRVTKRTYRIAAVLITGAAVVTVLAFQSGNFGGAGKTAALAHREYPEDAEQTEILQSEETTETEALSELTILASNEESQHLLGQRLEREIQDELAKEALEVEVIEREIRMQTQQAALEAREREARVQAQRAALEALAREQERKKRAVISYSAEDYQVLQKIVQAEAGGCDDKGKILVANVIINRVKNKKFPNSIKEVVYQPSQFSPVRDGRIDRCQVTQQTVDCVNRALAGEDYSGGALYFMNRGLAAPSNVRWFDDSLNYIMQHGGHEFFK